MSYNPLYTSEAMVKGLTQVTIGESSVPTTTQKLVWIEQLSRSSRRSTLSVSPRYPSW